MIRTRSAWLLAALLCAALLTGCGSSSTSTTSSSSSTPAAATTSSMKTPTPITSVPVPNSHASVPTGSIEQLAAQVCKSTTAQQDVPASMKAKVEEICHEAATGHEAQAEETARKVCAEAIKAIPGPNTPAKEKALAACAKVK
jgi:uncharacterized lipoprotein